GAAAPSGCAPSAPVPHRREYGRSSRCCKVRSRDSAARVTRTPVVNTTAESESVPELYESLLVQFQPSTRQRQTQDDPQSDLRRKPLGADQPANFHGYAR